MSLDSNQSESVTNIVDVTSVDDVACTSLASSTTTTVSVSTSNSTHYSDVGGESILEKLNAECSSLKATVPAPSLVPCVNFARTKIPPTVVRKRGRPRKQPLPLDPISNSENLTPHSNAFTQSSKRLPSKKKRKRKVKDYPWGRIKKKKKNLVEVRF